MNEEVQYVYYEGPKDELLRDLPPEGDDLVYGDFEVFDGDNWHKYYGSVSDLVRIAEDEAQQWFAYWAKEKMGKGLLSQFANI